MGVGLACERLHTGRTGIATVLLLAAAFVPGCRSAKPPQPRPPRRRPARPIPAAKDALPSGGYLETVVGAKKYAETMVDKVRLKALWTSLNTRAVMSGGKFPDKLADLGDRQLTKAPGKDGQAYQYIPGQRTTSPRANVLVFEAKPVHKGGKCLVLRVGGSIELLTPQQLQQAVDETKKTLP